MKNYQFLAAYLTALSLSTSLHAESAHVKCTDEMQTEIWVTLNDVTIHAGQYATPTYDYRVMTGNYSLGRNIAINLDERINNIQEVVSNIIWVPTGGTNYESFHHFKSLQINKPGKYENRMTIAIPAAGNNCYVNVSSITYVE